MSTAIATQTAAIISMLHERADANSATRHFRTVPVLRWTIDRLCRSESIDNVGVLCWEDQLDAVLPIAERDGVDILAKGPRRPIAELDRITAARKWADGWRGGLHSTCAIDAGFYAPWIKELVEKLDADTLVLVPPAAAMVDPGMIDVLIAFINETQTLDHAFAPAATGLAPMVVKRSLLDALVGSRSHPGRSLHYMPERPMLDPVGRGTSIPVPANVQQSTENFLLDSAAKIRRFTSAAVALNGSLIGTGSEELVRRLSAEPLTDALPREVVLELNTSRTTSPIYWPGKTLKIERPDLTLRTACRLFDELRSVDDLRLTIGGVGDPLRHPHLFDILAAAKSAGVHAIHVETDLAEVDESLAEKLATADVDVVSLFIPAVSPQMYATVMGIDAMARVLANLKAFVTERAQRASGVPLVVPTFVKMVTNLAEMDGWYDQWLNALGAAVIVGPSDCGGQIPTLAVADMTPMKRRACVRLGSRMTVLSDGRIASCEQDVTGKQTLGEIGKQSVEEIWTKRFGTLRDDHAKGAFIKHAVCNGCKEWHRS